MKISFFPEELDFLIRTIEEQHNALASRVSRGQPGSLAHKAAESDYRHAEWLLWKLRHFRKEVVNG